MNDLFFELIRVALGTHANLSRLPSANEWVELFELAKKQSLVGITFIGLQKLGADDTGGYTRIGMSEDTFFTWFGLAARITVTNDLVNKQCLKIQNELKSSSINSVILKGQSLALYYKDLASFRQSGDIDVYVDCGREKALAFARKLQGDVDWDYKHLHLEMFEDPSTNSGQVTQVEVHYRVEVVSNLIQNYRLQKFFSGNREMIFGKGASNGLGITSPTLEFNLFYILLHAYRHFLFEGVGLRLLMDYFFVLKARKVNGSGLMVYEDPVRTIERFGMKRFARGVMWIMQEVFGLDKECLIMEPDEKEGRYILDEIMRGGSFGMHDDRHANIKGANWKVADVKRRLRHSAHLFWHYPSEAFWNPVFIVWHKLWKISKQHIQ